MFKTKIGICYFYLLITSVTSDIVNILKTGSFVLLIALPHHGSLYHASWVKKKIKKIHTLLGKEMITNCSTGLKIKFVLTLFIFSSLLKPCLGNKIYWNLEKKDI